MPDWVKLLFESGSLGIFTYIVLTMLNKFLEYLERQDQKFISYLDKRDLALEKRDKEFQASLKEVNHSTQKQTEAILLLEKKIEAIR